jgi:hypothetical protein
MTVYRIETRELIARTLRVEAPDVAHARDLAEDGDYGAPAGQSAEEIDEVCLRCEIVSVTEE